MTDPPAVRSDSRPAWVLPAVVFAAALLVRTATLAQERAGNPLFLTPILDDATYLRLADELRNPAAAPRAWFLAPLYPWMLALATFGPSATMLIAGWLSAVTGSLAAAVVAVAARAAHSATAGWIAGLLYAAAGVVVFSEVLPGQEPALCLLHAAALLGVVAYFRRGAAPWIAAAFGVVVGVAMLGRATTVVLGVAFATLALARVRPMRRALVGVAFATLGAAVVLVPAAIRNASAFGDFTPLPWSGGPNLHMANGPFSRQFATFASPEIGLDPDTMERRAFDVAERAEGRKLRPSEVSAYWTRRTWDERGATSETAAHLGRKSLMFWETGDFANNHDAALEREWATWLRVVPVSSWWILALGAGGWWIARRRAPELDFAALAFVLTWTALTVYFPVSRYKLPLVPLAVVAMAAGVAELIAARESWRRAVVATAIVAAATGLSWIGSRRPTHSTGARNLAVVFASRGDAKAGIAVLRRSIETEPDDGPVRETLGRLLLDENQPAEALDQLRLSQSDERTRWSSGAAEVYALVALGRGPEAQKTAQMLADKPMPSAGLRAELFANWALADLACGDRAAAVAHLRTAEGIDAGSPAVGRARDAMSR